MADEAKPETVAPGEGQTSAEVKTEGLDHVKEKLEEKPLPNPEGAPAPTTAEGTSTTAAATTETTETKPIETSAPPASNPGGAEDASAGIAKDAGGTSSAAAVESPVASPTAGKRKSIVGTFKDFLGMGEKEKAKGKETAPAAEEGGYVAAATSAVAGATAAVSSALGYEDKPKTETETSATDAPATKDAAAASSSAPDPTTDSSVPTGEATDGEPTNLGSGADPKARENRQAIPSAGGEKLGEKHWGESNVIPDNPKPQAEGAAVASAEGQPTTEVKDNTAKNTGGATGGPATSKPAPATTEKKKLSDRIREKLKMGKKDK